MSAYYSYFFVKESPRQLLESTVDLKTLYSLLNKSHMSASILYAYKRYEAENAWSQLADRVSSLEQMPKHLSRAHVYLIYDLNFS